MHFQIKIRTRAVFLRNRHLPKNEYFRQKNLPPPCLRIRFSSLGRTVGNPKKPFAFFDYMFVQDTVRPLAKLKCRALAKRLYGNFQREAYDERGSMALVEVGMRG